MKKTLVALIAAACTLPALATPTIDKISVSPSPAKVGETVKVSVDFRDAPDGLCGLEVEFGDKDSSKKQLAINSDTKTPVVFEYVYDKPGEAYKVRATGGRVANALGCLGKKDTLLQVTAAAPVAAAAAAPVGCPSGWAMKGKAAKDGSFTCTPDKANKDGAKPAEALKCPAGTSYFTKGKTLGCEKG
ncbi:MAG: hypothetical protein RIR00_1779 [Pseudomonadota bacterium]|jgi:hypothetical protein